MQAIHAPVYADQTRALCKRRGRRRASQRLARRGAHATAPGGAGRGARLVAVDAGVLERELDAGGHAQAVRARVGHVVRVARHRAAQVLRQDGRAALLRAVR